MLESPRENRMKGRKRKLGVRRYPTGQIIQPPARETAEAVQSTVREARQRVFGLSETKATEPDAVDILGRMYLAGEISQRQKEAGDRYAEIRRNYRKAILARRLPSAGDLDRQRGHDDSDGTDPAYVVWCERSIAAYDRLWSALRDCGEPLAIPVLDGVIDDQPLWDFIGVLRIALNTIARRDARQ